MLLVFCSRSSSGGGVASRLNELSFGFVASSSSSELVKISVNCVSSDFRFSRSLYTFDFFAGASFPSGSVFSSFSRLRRLRLLRLNGLAFFFFSSSF